MKVFISQPFHGKSEEEIMAKRKELVNKLERRYDEHIEVIDNYHKEDIPDGTGRLWFLGDSIKLMDEADLVVFAEDWECAKGCVIENQAAVLYGKIVVLEEYM